MAFNGPPMEEHLLARVTRWFNSIAGGVFWPLNRGTEDRPADNGPPLLPDYEEEEEIDVVGVADEEELQVEPHGAHGEGERDGGPQQQEHPPLLPDYEEEEEEIDVVGDGRGRFDRPDSRRGEEREEELNRNRPASPPRQQFPPPNGGREGEQRDPAARFPVPHADPYAAFAFPYAPPFASPYATPFVPLAPPFAPPYVPPFAPPYAPPFVPHAPPFAYPYAPLFAVPYAPRIFFDAPLRADPHTPPHADPHAFPDDAAVAEAERSEPPELETLGPLSSEECLGFFSSDSSLEEDPHSSTRRRSREESDEEQVAPKRPRWSDESDSD